MKRRRKSLLMKSTQLSQKLTQTVFLNVSIERHYLPYESKIKGIFI